MWGEASRRAALLGRDAELNRRNYYEASVQRDAPLPPAQGALRVDVLVVGAGFSGLSAAIELARRGYRVAVLEAGRVCGGASGRNGGQAIAGFAGGQQPFETQLGRADARLAWDMSLQALDLLDARIAEFGIDCDRRFGYLYVADAPRKARALEAEFAQLERDYGFATTLARGPEVRALIDSPRYCAAVYERRSGHLHPLKYGLGLLRAAQSLGVQVFEHAAVRSLSRGAELVARTDGGQISAKFAVLAGNYSLEAHGPDVAPTINRRVMPVGTYILGTAPLGYMLCQKLIPAGAAVCDNNVVLDYFRCSADHRMLFGGRVSYSQTTPPNLERVMQGRMERIFPQLRGVAVEFLWGGFVDISMNRAPDFGRVDHNIYYLQGFSGHGVALSGLAGQLAAQAIAGQAERFDLFARLQHRNFPGGSLLRTPALVLGMAYHRLRDML
jgi:gamma-glutamylputrescine oxidase